MGLAVKTGILGERWPAGGFELVPSSMPGACGGANGPGLKPVQLRLDFSGLKAVAPFVAMDSDWLGDGRDLPGRAGCRTGSRAGLGVFI
jgi:hypothetical protein